MVAMETLEILELGELLKVQNRAASQ